MVKTHTPLGESQIRYERDNYAKGTRIPNFSLNWEKQTKKYNQELGTHAAISKLQSGSNDNQQNEKQE